MKKSILTIICCIAILISSVSFVCIRTYTIYNGLDIVLSNELGSFADIDFRKGFSKNTFNVPDGFFLINAVKCDGFYYVSAKTEENGKTVYYFFKMDKSGVVNQQKAEFKPTSITVCNGFFAVTDSAMSIYKMNFDLTEVTLVCNTSINTCCQIKKPVKYNDGIIFPVSVKDGETEWHYYDGEKETVFGMYDKQFEILGEIDDNTFLVLNGKTFSKFSSVGNELTELTEIPEDYEIADISFDKSESQIFILTTNVVVFDYSPYYVYNIEKQKLRVFPEFLRNHKEDGVLTSVYTYVQLLA